MHRKLRKATLRDLFRLYLGLPSGLKRARVAGNSMAPVIQDGDVVLYDPAGSPAKGDIVISAHPFRQSVVMVKRVAAIDGGGTVTLVGDNPVESTDSRALGAIPIKLIKGLVVCKR